MQRLAVNDAQAIGTLGRILGRMVIVVAVPVIGYTLTRVLTRKRQRSSKLLPAPTWLSFRLPGSSSSSTVWDAVMVLAWLCTMLSFADTDDWPRVFGYLAAANAVLVMLPSNRFSIATWLVQIPFERALKYHRWLGAATVILSIVHVAAYWASWLGNGSFIANTLFIKYAFGTLGFVALLALYLLSLDFVRRDSFDVFYISHFLLFPVFLVMSCLHSPPILVYLSPALLLYLADRAVRRVRSKPSTVLQASLASPGVLRLLLQPYQPGFTFLAGQYVFVNIPSLSAWQWHPFTISSAPGAARFLPDDTSSAADGGSVPPANAIVVHIQSLGDWTQRAVALANAPLNSLRVCVDGPYGMLAFPYQSYDTCVLIGGGIGITPMLSILEDIDAAMVKASQGSSGHGAKPSTVYFFWVMRRQQMYRLFGPVLHRITTRSKHRSSFQCRVWVTQPEDPASLAHHKSWALRTGRPNVFKLMQGIARVHAAEKRVAVYACGPLSLLDASQDACAVLSHRKACPRFDFHHETFQF